VNKATPEIASFDEQLLLEQQSAASYRTTADRYRRLLAETTTPALTQYLGAMITRCEALAREGKESD
jgi:hypothetical protein